MRKYVILIVYLIISVFKLNAITYNTYNADVYGNPYASTYNYIPFKSTSSNIQNINYNTVRPLNADGSVSIEYTTYKGVYSPRRNSGLDIDPDEDDPIGGTPTPIGEPIIPCLVIMFVYIICREIKNKLFMQKNEA